MRRAIVARIGQPLVVSGVVSGTDCAPLPGATVQAWQTNGNGRYGPILDAPAASAEYDITLRPR
jgi:protocatechuate 3,4-dioxygenase beta subunit